MKIGVFGIKFLKIRAQVIKLEFVKENEKRYLRNWTARPWTCEGWIHNNDCNKVLRVWINNNNSNKISKVWINDNNNNNNKILRIELIIIIIIRF